jgi:hypothetical protein
MRNAPALLMTLLTLCGCNGHDKHVQLASPDLERLATGLQEAWPGSTYLVQMTMTITRTAGHEFLHCRLWNTSATVLELDRSGLPWVAPGLFHVGVVTATGRVLPRAPVLMQLGPEPDSISLAPGQALEGDFDLNHLPGGPYPRDDDLLLLWSHGIAIGGRTEGVRVTGITLLPKWAH